MKQKKTKTSFEIPAGLQIPQTATSPRPFCWRIKSWREERFNQYFKFQSHSNDLAPTTVEERNKTSSLNCMCNCLLLQVLLLSLSKIKSFNYAGSSVPAPICLTATESGWHFFWRGKLTFCSHVICNRLPVNRSTPCEQGDTPQVLWPILCGHSLLVSNCYLN